MGSIAMGTVLLKMIAMTTAFTGVTPLDADMTAFTAGISALWATAMGTVATRAVVLEAIAMGAVATFAAGRTIADGPNTLGRGLLGAHNLWSRRGQVALIMHFHFYTSRGSS